MKSVLAAAGFLALASGWAITDKPVDKDTSPRKLILLIASVNAALGQKYTIKEITDSPAYTDAKAISGSSPQSAKSDSGEELKGYVLIAYVVSAEGTAVDPVILKTTDERLNKIGLGAMTDWRFQPARLNGKAIPITAAQEFNFKGTATGFATSNIVLYQANADLEVRVPSAEALADYIKRLQAVATDLFAPDKTPENLDIVIVVKPGKKARVWFVSSIRPGTDPSLEPLRQKLEAVDPLDVEAGPVAFAISSTIAGAAAKPPAQDGKFQPPIPTGSGPMPFGKPKATPRNSTIWSSPFGQISEGGPQDFKRLSYGACLGITPLAGV